MSDKNVLRSGFMPSALSLMVFMFTIFSLAGCSRPTTLEKIEQEHVLHVITRNGPAIYFEDKDGPAGFDYEISKLFAEELGVELRLRVADNLGELLSVIDQGYAHFAAGGLAATEGRNARFEYSSPYLEITPKVVYRLGTSRPKELTDLVGKRLVVVADSHHIDLLKQLKQDFIDLTWEESEELETSDLLKQVSEGLIDYAIVDSTDLAIHQAYYPKAVAAFSLSKPLNFVWYFPASEDDSLTQKATLFFEKIKNDGTLLQLKERYYGHLNQLNYVGARTFIHHINKRLSRYEETFKAEADNYELDWRLLAAIGYQESHWRPNATSPTGVRGLMMLTRVTAKELGIKNRLDPSASIKGGAKYFAKIRARIPDRIKEPDRTWMALASYNVGFGHVEDARILAQKDGKDPDQWLHVKEYLPLLQKKKWYKQTRHGYARGSEPVVYVQNIRRYYDVLTWMKQPQVDEGIIASKSSEEPYSEEPSDNYMFPDTLQDMPPTL
ncbi:membrane-bound lytic murein transglycosylase MltF [Alkalimarinus alittae]|uniref:Membrane-bound lytic murein transglycosylase F n=1 Tax=Alkalimarinus alittae TaxID=2961619 RepID=A0ABY6MYK0_9ALTE|nr:membrane-bound lytic murein transglycosylase MltF [Alkalimarinus alittae]UZE94904.1 membrane-bound lytic murein transglycosylase MltF [Alkalimarinus alittae]